jgi:energy-coupling factor transporter ATP-binding protein EcfA2
MDWVTDVPASKIDQLNSALTSAARITSAQPLLVLLTGASGAGKTHLTEHLEKSLNSEYVSVDYFDRIGVPSYEEMVREFGSGERWQEAKTHEWIHKLSLKTDKTATILEGQYNPSFALAACQSAGIKRFVLAVIDASDQVREKRLSDLRGQPELANLDMRNWARVLREKTLECGGSVIDTSDGDLQRCTEEVAVLILNALRR